MGPAFQGVSARRLAGSHDPSSVSAPVCHGPQASTSGLQARVWPFSAQELGPSLRGSQPAASCSGSQGRDLQLCVWDLAEGRNAVVDAVRLENMGFCRASVLGEGPQRWMVAVPGRGNDEVSEPRAALGSLSGRGLVFYMVAMVVGLGRGPRWAEVSGRPSGHQEQADPVVQVGLRAGPAGEVAFRGQSWAPA